MRAMAISLVVLGATGAFQGATGQGAGRAMETAEYTVVFKSTWTAATHPFEYPAVGVLSGPHFSGLIGATPSPDWFTGAANVSLLENGTWVASRTLMLPAYDSGGDDGATYKAADMDANPKHGTMRAATQHFVSGGKAVPVATVTFRKN